MEYFH